MARGSASGRRDPAADRFLTALFVAALLHGLLILGVSFGTADGDRPLPTLEILLVPPGPDAVTPNERAPYLAQRNQNGFGDGAAAKRSSLPEARPPAEETDAVPQPTQPADAPDARGNVSLLARQSLDAGRASPGAVRPDSPTPIDYQPVAEPPSIALNAAVAERELHLRGDRSVDGQLLADTRESAIAVYLDGWKRRIERVGTLNFPDEARRRGLSGNPVLEVAIRADGSLEAVVVRRSSGHPELDRAAVGIVRLAAPFDPFPGALRARYPVLRFAYEWQFLDGRLGGNGAVFSGRP
ncbi:MAG: energy transducer TonB [Steroidobacteraceae bacterium]